MVDNESGQTEEQKRNWRESPAQPRKEILDLQSTWLAPARSRLLRRIEIARRKSILDLGAGFGNTTVELAQRSSGNVSAVDINPSSLREIVRANDIGGLAGDAAQLPFQKAAFDLVFCQCALLWMSPLKKVIGEIERLLKPAGVLIALEPDYAAMIEYPPEISTRGIWLDALARSGAEPQIGRKLPGLLAAEGFSVRVNLLERVHQPSLDRFEFLEGLHLTETERSKLQTIRKVAAGKNLGDWQQIALLPFFLITAEKPATSGY